MKICLVALRHLSDGTFAVTERLTNFERLAKDWRGATGNFPTKISPK